MGKYFGTDGIRGKYGEKQDEAELKKLEALEKREGKSRLNDK